MWRRMRQPSDVVLGVGLAVLALWVIGLASQMTVGFSYDKVGPRTFPYLIASLLLLSSVAIIGGAFSGGPRERGSDDPVQWLPIALISATLIFQLFVVQEIGWIPAATISFAVCAFAFDERRMLLNLLFGFLLACGTYVLFNYGLQLRLPAGYFLEGLL